MHQRTRMHSYGGTEGQGPTTERPLPRRQERVERGHTWQALQQASRALLLPVVRQDPAQENRSWSRSHTRTQRGRVSPPGTASPCPAHTAPFIFHKKLKSSIRFADEENEMWRSTEIYLASQSPYSSYHIMAVRNAWKTGPSTACRL